MQFDIVPILDRLNIKYERVRGSNELLMDCRVCGRTDHFYYNAVKNLCTCQKCKWESNALGFLLVLGFSKKEAVQAIFGRFDHSLAGLHGRIKNLLVRLDNFEELTLSPVYFNIPLPDGCEEITEKNFPKALAERKISLKFVKKVNAKICNKGKYSNRIIFPVNSGKNRTFAAHTGFTRKKARIVKESARKRGVNFRKVLFPFGSFMGEILYLFNDMFKKKGDLFVVEGVMDALSMLRRKKNVVASFGDKVGVTQALLLSLTNADTIYLMLDGEVPLERVIKYTKRIAKFCLDKRVMACLLPFGKDPDDCTDEEVELSINLSHSLHMLRTLFFLRKGITYEQFERDKK